MVMLPSMKLRLEQPVRTKVRYVPFSEAVERRAMRFVPLQPKQVRPSEPPPPRSRLGWVTIGLYLAVGVAVTPLMVRASNVERTSRVAPENEAPVVAAVQEVTAPPAAPTPVVAALATDARPSTGARSRARRVVESEPVAASVREGLAHIDGPPPNPFE